MSRDRGKPIRDQTGLICFFYKKMDSVLKMSLSIEYHTKSDPPLTKEMVKIEYIIDVPYLFAFPSPLCS